MDAPHLPSASGGGLAAPSPSPVSRVGAAATPWSALSATRPGGTEPSRHSPPLLPPALRPAFPRGTAPPTHLRPSTLLSPPSRGGSSSSSSSQRRSRRRRWPGSPWRTVREAARRKSATTTMVRGRPAGGWVGGQGCGAGPGAAPGSAAAVASGRRC